MTAPILHLPAGGRTRWTLPALIAVVTLMALLVAATGLGAAGIGTRVDRQHDARLMVQVTQADAARVLALLGTTPEVARATPVDARDLARVLRPWLGDGPARPTLPALIDVDLRDPATAPVVEQRLRATGAVIRIDRPERWLSPIGDLMRGVTGIAALLVVALVLATGAIVLLAVGRDLAMHRAAIGVMHMLGATDGQLVAPFRRRVAIGAATGAATGSGAALAIVVLAGTRLATLESDTAAAATLHPAGGAMLAAVPIAIVALAMLVAHLAVVRALGRLT